VWDVDEAAAANVWTVEIEGARGAVTQLDLIDVEFADNGVDAVRSDGLLRFATDDGSVAVSGTFIVAPGRYLIGMSQAGVAGQYVVNLRPTPLAQGSSSFREGVSHTGAFTTHAQLSGGFEVPFRIADDQAGYVWGASFHAPIGTAPTLSIEGPGGTVAQVTFHDHGPVRLSNLGLPAGEYRARVQPASAAESGLVSFRLEAMGLAANGVEIEPNNSWGNASWFGLGEEVKGIT